MSQNERRSIAAAIRPLFNPLIIIVYLAFALPALAQQSSDAGKPAMNYGQNAAAGSYATLNGIKLYFETYGSGKPLLVIHPNGGSIAAMTNQIRYFASRRQVIAADSRGHGKSEMGKGRLTYGQMAEDFNSLLEQRSLKSVDVLGWSDGGIIGLLLAIHHPDKVAKLAIMGANLAPSGAYDWALRWVAREDREADAMLAKGDKSEPWPVIKQYLGLMATQPNIPVADLHKIAAPTLVMAGDRDVIRTEHTVEIFENIPNAHLCIFPGSTHMIPVQNPELFDRTVGDFFDAPYSRPDTKDFFK